MHRSVFYLKHDVTEAGFCLRLQVETPQLGPTYEASPCLRTNLELHLKTETEHSLRNVVF
jgi:hypothetical protein